MEIFCKCEHSEILIKSEINMLQTVDSNNNNLYFILNFYLDFYGR